MRKFPPIRMLRILAASMIAFGFGSNSEYFAASNPTLFAQTTDELPQNALWQFGEMPGDNGVHRIFYSPNGKLLATRNRENVVKIYDVETKKLLCEVEGHENNWVLTIDFSPDSRFFMTAAGPSENVKIWVTQTGKLESEIETDAEAAYFSQSGDAINLLGETHVEFYTWPGVQLAKKRKWKSGNETRAGMSRDGNIVVSYRSVNGQVFRTQLIDLESKSKIQLDGPTAIPENVAFSPNQNWIAAAYKHGQKIRLWDRRDPHQQKFILNKHKESVRSVAFSADSRFLASSSWDKTAITWDLLTREPFAQLEGHTERVFAATFSPTELVLASGASGNSDTSTILWNLKDYLFSPDIKPPVNEFEDVWKNLGSHNLKTSLTATSQFMLGGDEYLAIVEKHVGKTIADNTAGSIDETIKLLEHPEWVVREKATQQLLAIRQKADAELRQALIKATSPEVKFRISRVLKKKMVQPIINFVESRRWSRIIFALETIQTDRSQKLLNQIAASPINMEIARDAKDAFSRVESREN